MNRLILKLYDKMKQAPALLWGLCLVLTIGLICSVRTLSYKEDISDFLPLDERNQTALSVYQDISGAGKVYAIIGTADTLETDPEVLASGVEAFVDKVEALDSLDYVRSIIKELDMDKMLGVVDMVYDRVPYFLTDADYDRMDSLLSSPDYVPRQLSEAKQLLLFPSGNVLSGNISRDPLNLFSPILGRMKRVGMPINFEIYDGYILTPDGKRAIVILESAFGAHESEHNTALVRMLSEAKRETEGEHPELDVHIIGGLVIAVGNAQQIKSDSIMAVCIAGVLIVLLLIYVFRDLRNILLIVVSVSWGWLFALGGIALYYDSISIIVVGIASVIIGIAVNYPLHLIDHLKDSDHPRSALREIISPLIVGNVTTVGAFLCLVPLNAPALRDLGLFSSFLLVGTIVFVLLFLPHIIRVRPAGAPTKVEPSLVTKLAGITIEDNKWLVGGVLVLTFVFGYFSMRTEFDSDMRNINYMTPEQRADMAYFQGLLNSSTGTESLYVVSQGDSWSDAFRAGEQIAPVIDSIASSPAGVVRQSEAASFLVSESEQERRLLRWQAFVARWQGLLTDSLTASARAQGFSEEAFAPFREIIASSYEAQGFDHFRDFASTVFVGSFSEDGRTGRKYFVQTLSVPTESMEAVKSQLEERAGPDGLLFDVKSLNGSIAHTLSDDINYIGVACSLIVFIFLWISLGRIELAVVSFVPMAFSWVWILGIMGLFGIKFNIVNVILATFIFGQGDDYTIFMTEGLSYELAYRRRLLSSYKNSIVISALIMFVGIGTLLFAQHPALRSLGEVTVVGMLSVVLMAYLFPPLIFKWLVQVGGKLRYRPVTLGKVLHTAYCTMVFGVQLVSAYALGFCLFVLTKATPQKRFLFHRYCCALFRLDIKRMPSVRLAYKNDVGETFERPAVIISNHQSTLDTFCLLTLSPKIVLLAKEHIRLNPIVGTIFRWLDFLTITEGSEGIIERLRGLVAEGYSIAIFPEGERADGADTRRVRRFHKGAFVIAETLGLDVLPVYLDGIAQIMPKGSMFYNGGTMYIEVGKRISREELERMDDTLAQAKAIRARYTERLSQIHLELSTVSVLSPIILDRYIYKGREVERLARRALKAYQAQEPQLGLWLADAGASLEFVVVDRGGQGELALLLALRHPEARVSCYLPSEEARDLLRASAQDFAPNVQVIERPDDLSPSKAEGADLGARVKVCEVVRDGEASSLLEGATLLRF